MILTSKQHAAVHLNLLMLFCFLLPFHPRLATSISVFLGINWLLSGTWFRNKKNLLNPLCLIFFGFYILHVFGLFHTENMNQGLQEVETKFSLLFFPLLFFSFPLQVKSQFEQLLKAFIGGCFFVSVYCFLSAGREYLGHFYYQCFCYTRFSAHINSHPTYLGMYISLAFFMILFFLKKNKTRSKIFLNIGYCILSIWLFIVILFISSRIIVLGTSFIIIAGCLGATLKSKNFIKGFGISAIVILILSCSIKNFPCVKSRAKKEIVLSDAAVNSSVERVKKQDSRILSWTSALDIIKNNPFVGVGTGDAEDALQDVYVIVNHEEGIENNYDAHNQILQTSISLGIIGGVYILLMFVFPFSLAFRNQNYLYMVFLALLGITFLTESILETERGTLFYGFFNSLFASSLFYFSKGKKKTPQNEVNHFEG